jgi:hypothetical protein
MLQFLGEDSGDRKLRLFAIACCLRLVDLIGDERTLQAIRVAERLAESVATKTEHRAAYDDAFEAAEDLHQTYLNMAGHSPPGAAEAERLRQIASLAAMGEWLLADGWGAAEQVVYLEWDHVTGKTRSGQEPSLLRDIFGNPFRTVVIDPAWLTVSVRNLARAIYDERGFDRLPILADALEDAGCDDAELLTHCRSEGPHVRGCWAVGLILGKK